MNLEEAIRIAEILEADDCISAYAMSCRTLLKTVKELTDKIVDLELELKEIKSE